MIPRFARLSLRWKILLSTSIAVTALFALTGWMVLGTAVSTTTQSIEDEVGASLQAYRSLWAARAKNLASVSRVLSAMSDVRAAFTTRDQATIRDSAGELWSMVSDEDASFLVTEPNGRVIASLGGAPIASLREDVDVVRRAARRFPQQASGFTVRDGNLYQVVVTPVYVQSGREPALLNVLVAGFVVDPLVALKLKQATGGSEFLFLSQGRVFASTVNARATERIAAAVAIRPNSRLVSDGAVEYSPARTPLLDIDGKPLGELWILRSFEAAQQRIAGLRRNIIGLWLFAIAAGFLLTYLLARNIVRPVEELDRAAAEVARQNYDYQVKIESQDEIGRLARTFNSMCTSIRQAREELIRQERISTIGRLSSSIVHDLRNPLAAIYGGAEMLVDADLAPAQVKRLAGNIYRASRRIQELLQDLLNVSRGKSEARELCRVRETALAAAEAMLPAADAHGVEIDVRIPDDIELPLERARIERVFLNLIANAVDVMPAGGRIQISAAISNGRARVEVADNGPGIATEIRDRLFQPFVTAGKKNGLGLGLALSRQAVMDHGGDMWVLSEPGKGARFCFSLPLQEHTAAKTA